MTAPTPDPGAEPRTRLRRAVRLARRVYLAGLCAAAAWLVSTRWHEIGELLEETRPGFIAAALVSSFGLIGLGALLWHSSLRMLGHPVKYREILLATGRSLPARYVPLGVTYAAARVVLLRAAGGRMAPLAVTAGLEMVVSVSVALAAGTAVLSLAGSLPGAAAWMAAAAVAAVAISAAGGRVVAALAARRGVRLTVAWPGYAQVLASSALYWGWAAFTFVLYLRAFAAADGLGSLEVAGAFMVAWAVGFLAVLAPQGIGVAELGLVALLGSGERGGIAMAAVFAGYRFVQIVRDLAAAAAGEFIAIRRARRGSAPKG